MFALRLRVSGCRNGHDTKLCVLRASLLRRVPAAVTLSVSLPQVPTASRRWIQTEACFDADVDNIRNIGIIAHVDAGKTTTTERMLFHSGLIRHIGNVDHGDTVTDFLPMERDRGITIQSAAITFHWPPADRCPPETPPKTINLIDTPGHQDFRFEVDRCMPVLDGAVCIIDSVKGVEAHTERVWASAHQFRIPRIMYVNKLDRDGASFRRSVADIAVRLNAWPLVCQIPWWEKDVFVGVVDVVERVGYRWKASSGVKTTVPPARLADVLLQSSPALADKVETARQALLEVLCEHDEQLLLMDEDKVSPALIKQTIRRLIGSGDGRLVPVFAGSSLRNIGVDPLLDAVVDYLPGPNERPPVDVLSEGRVRSTLDEAIQAAHNQKSGRSQVGIAAVASVFKVAADFNSHDSTKSMLSFVRLYHGTLPRTAELWNSTRGTSEKASGMVQISANKTHMISHLRTGQIGALKGLKDAKTGDTLLLLTGCGHGRSSRDSSLRTLQIRPAEIPSPVAFITMAPPSLSGLKPLEAALEKLSREDPSLRVSFDDKSELFVLSGMGRLHLEVSLDRLKHVYKVAAVVYGIEVDYKECLLSATSPQRYVFDQIVNSRSGKAACTVSLGPAPSPDDLPNLDDNPAPSLSGRAFAKAGGGALKAGGPQDNAPQMQDENNLVRVSFAEPSEDKRWPDGFDPERVRHELRKGASAALRMGPRLRRPVHGCAVEVLYDPATDFFGASTPSSHNVKAAYNAVKACLKEAYARDQIGVLEPVMRVEISCPEASADAIQQDITGVRGGLVLEVSDSIKPSALTSATPADAGAGAGAGGMIPLHEVYLPPDPYDSVHSLRDPMKGLARMLEIKAIVPLKEMLDYDSRLRSQTGGRHALNMTLDTFQRVTGQREKALG